MRSQTNSSNKGLHRARALSVLTGNPGGPGTPGKPEGPYRKKQGGHHSVIILAGLGKAGKQESYGWGEGQSLTTYYAFLLNSRVNFQVLLLQIAAKRRNSGPPLPSWGWVGVGWGKQDIGGTRIGWAVGEEQDGSHPTEHCPVVEV